MTATVGPDYRMAMTPPTLPRTRLQLPSPLLAGLCLLIPLACSEGVQQAKPVEAAENPNPYGIEEWYPDFPYPLAMPAVRKPGAWYDKSRRAALRQVAANLEGACSAEAWRMAREFFDLCQDEAQSLLIETMDRGLTQPQRHSTLALNTVKAMGRVKNPAYADALLRALEYPDLTIREAAVTAMIKAGNADVVRRVGGYFHQLSLKERLSWMKACVAHLPDEELVPILTDFLTKIEHSHMRLPTIQECMKLPAARGAKLLSRAYDDLTKDLQVMVAPVFHAVGDPRGLGTLRQAIRGKDRALQVLAVQGVRRGKVAPLVDDILELTNQELIVDDADVALLVAIIQTLQKVPGDRIRDVMLMFTTAVAAPVRQAAYQALFQRGETRALDELLEVARTSTGMQRNNAIADLVACGYDKVLPLVMESYRKASGTDRMWYIRGLATSGNKAAFAHLKEIFMEPERRFSARDPHTNVTFMGVQFSNMSESIYEILGLLESLPRAEYRRRAALVHALSNVAGLHDDERWARDVYAALRRIVHNRKDIPQLRILALQYLLKDLRLEDAMELKRGLSAERPQMRSYFSDYLFEYF